MKKGANILSGRFAFTSCPGDTTENKRNALQSEGQLSPEQVALLEDLTKLFVQENIRLCHHFLSHRQWSSGQTKRESLPNRHTNPNKNLTEVLTLLNAFQN